MNYYEVSMVGNVGAYRDVLTYQHDVNLPIGTIVQVPVGRSNKPCLGVIERRVAKPDYECKPLLKIVADQPLPDSLVRLHHWMTSYYATNSGTTWQAILPTRVGVQPRNTKVPTNTIQQADCTHFLLNDQQQTAVQKIRQTTSGTILLHGITGSGKTEVYKTIAQDAISAGKSAIILVPEISLTTQLVQDFQKTFANVVVTHSAMTASERNRVWRHILFNPEPQVIIGPRSALFMPVHNLGLVVIDECHEPTYKQEQSPRYHARDVASKLCQFGGAKLILGSATPPISDYYLAQHFDRPIVIMDKLAKQDAIKPSLHIVNLTDKDNFSLESSLFSKVLLDNMREALKNHRQVLLFHNRRGTAGLAMCESCGHLVACPNCFTPLTLHGDKFKLVCHICGHTERPPLVCPDCHEATMVYKGIGTKRIEAEVQRLFPRATVRRFDGDTIKGQAVNDLYDELRDGQIDVIIGTQTIAKGLNLPKLAVVGIVQADAGLALPDFSASERTFQLVAQACGRVGRNNQTTTAIIQTYQPTAPAVKYGATQDYASFYSDELPRRKHGHFPPFTHLLRLSCAYKTEAGAVTASRRLAAKIHDQYGGQVHILGPSPSFYERMRGLYRWQIIVRASKRQTLVDIANSLTTRKTNWQIELDPISLL